ncbi:hypothetical protein OHT57_02170 [Streptomyces sp. NBC_00285]|uniref:hypothetical protein n=1 Tax=Streptomyces sp. NBC_00285 TaxID=2975700 RepID=UPI002E2C029A|nr:hypothetical protein [Streptomyces sp. NBC_00285]
MSDFHGVGANVTAVAGGIGAATAARRGTRVAVLDLPTATTRPDSCRAVRVLEMGVRFHPCF